LHSKKNWLLFCVTIFILFVLSGCAGSPSVFAPVGDNAQLITNLINNIFLVAAVVFVIVEGLLVFAAVRFSRKGIKSASQTEGNTPLEIGWTLFPAVVLAIVFVLSLGTLQTVSSQSIAASLYPSDQKAVTVRVIGHQWWWEFNYPELGITTANEMHVPINTVVHLDIESVDVIHSFWVPQLGGKTDAIPGHVNKTWFRATQLGTFYGTCAEFCGIEHAVMRLNVIVDSPEKFQTWVQGQKTATPTLTGAALAGSDIFQKASCGVCHTINDTAWQGKIGPNLTHLNSRSIIAGGALQNTPENLARWIANPQAVKPGNLMPNLELSNENIQSILEFLKVLN
jgi:cytochrome c oxidase subunit 2